jgi:hypothetical protein
MLPVTWMIYMFVYRIRIRSPFDHCHMSDRKRRCPSSPRLETTVTITPLSQHESTTLENISSGKSKSSRDDNEHRFKTRSKHRSSSRSPLPTSRTTSDRATSESSDDKSCHGSENNRSNHHLIHRTSKRDDYYTYRSQTTRNYHDLSSKRTAFVQHRSTTKPIVHVSSVSRRIQSPNSVDHLSTNQEIKSDEHKTIYNHMETNNEMNNSVVTNNQNANKSVTPVFNATNGSAQRSRSNLIQIVTTEATSTSKSM